MQTKKLSQYIGVKGLFGLFFIYSLLSANPLLTVFTFTTLYVIIQQLQRPLFPAILLFCMVYQWLQGSVRVFQANLAGVSINVLDQSENAAVAVGATTLGVLIMTLIFSSVIKKNEFSFSRLQEHLYNLSPYKIFLTYLIFLFLLTPILRIFKVGGLAQLIVAIESLRWVLFVLLFSTVLIQKNAYVYFIIVFLGEVLLGFTGFFSGFKTPILFTAIVYISFVRNFTSRAIGLTGLGIAFVFFLALFWTSVKVNYRQFLNRGTQTQAVYVNQNEALNYLVKQIPATSLDDLEVAFDDLLNRLQYTKMIQYTMDYVPNSVPHENGKLWWQAVTHIFTPRILFPNKKILDDSEISNKYTGMRWAGREQGTSISIGYISEAYVDFGLWGMFLPLSLLAFILAKVHKSFLSRKREYPAFEFSAVIVLFFQFNKVETAANKILGGMIMFLIVYTFIIRPFIFPYLFRFIKK